MLKNTKKVNAHISQFSDVKIDGHDSTENKWMQISHYELQKKQQNQSTKNILNEKETDELTICGVGRSCSKSFK